MKKIKIKKIKIFNLKIFKEKEIFFNESDFVILDGPNGYGKTSLFDSIELLLTGSIERIKRLPFDHKRKFSEQLLINDPDLEDCYVKIEISIDNEVYFFARSLDSSADTKNHPDDFSGFKLHKLSSFEELASNENRCDDNLLKVILGDRFFKLYSRMHYLEQEESTFYVKQSATQKRDMLGYLFNIEQEEKELSEQEKISRTLRRIHKTHEKKLNSDRKTLETLTNQETYEISKDEPYFQLFENSDFDWDKKEITIERSSWQEVKEQLKIAQDICAYPNDFRQSRVNNFIDKYSDNTDLITFTVKLASFASKDKEIKDAKAIISRYEKSLSSLEKFKEQASSLDIKNLKKLFSEKSKINFDNLEKDYEKLTKAQEQNNNLIKEQQQIKTARDTLRTHIVKHSISECLLCSMSYESSEKLLQAIEEKWKLIEKKRSNREKLYINLVTSIQETYLNPLATQIRSLVKTIHNEYPSDFLRSYNPSQQMIDDYHAFEKGLKSLAFPLSEYMNTNMDFSESAINDLVDKLTIALINSKKSCDSRFYEKSYTAAYKEILDSNLPAARKLNPDLFNNKIRYIENEIQRKQNKVLKNLIKEIKTNELLLEKINTKLTVLDKTVPKYRKAINDYKNKIIDLIQIPFFIFSGRIIQSFNKGSGFILKSSEEGSKELKFVSNSNAEHDAVYSLSSGQLSALVISFMLALNKVYASSNLIFIDDPVQSMDDINTSSFIELLRNDFKDSFVILSTHEDHISNYMDYKFSLAGLQVSRHNLKDG